MSPDEEIDEVQRYRELFRRHFGLLFDYGWAGTRLKYITLSKVRPSYTTTFMEAYGDDFASCIHVFMNKLCTLGLIPDIDKLGPFPPFSSASELKMKLELRGK